MKSLFAIGPLLLSLLLSCGCGRPCVSSPDPEIVATVDGAPIRRSQFEREAALAHASGRTNLEAAWEAFIQRERLVARARRLGLEQDPDVQQAIKNVLIAKLKEKELEPRLRALTISEEDLQAGRQIENKRMNRIPQMRLAMLRLQINPKASPAKLKATEARLEEARVKAQSLPPNTIGFGALAIDYSDDDTTRYRGGDLGWLDKDSARYHFDPAMLSAGSALKTPGETSPIIRGNEALFLVRLIGQRATEEATPKPADDLVRHRAHLEKRHALENEFVEETKRLIPVTVDAAAISNLATSIKPPAARHPATVPQDSQ